MKKLSVIETVSVPMAKVSTTVRKLGKIPSINLPPDVTCRPDAPCANGCYAKKGHFVQTTSKNRQRENLECFNLNPDVYFRVIDHFLTNPVVIYKYFRYHCSGDIPNMDYLDHMCKLAEKHTFTRFLCYTKKYELCNEYFSSHTKPENLIIVFSMWGDFGTQFENPNHFPKSWVEFKKAPSYIPEDSKSCPGQCDECLKCWYLQTDQNVVFKQH